MVLSFRGIPGRRFSLPLLVLALPLVELDALANIRLRWTEFSLAAIRAMQGIYVYATRSKCMKVNAN